MHKSVLSLFLSSLLATLLGGAAYGQDWREPNPNQANGYHATEAENHYHGNYHEPAQVQNGYRASEARSHYGGSRFEPSGGWDYQNNSGPGSAFSNERSSNGGPGSAFSNASAYSNASAFRNGGPENTLTERLRRSARWQQNYRNLAAAGYVPGGTSSERANTAASGGFASFASRLSTFEPMIQREQAMRQRAIQSIEDGHGGFNRIYQGE
jgi:hypothetical protein